MLYRTKISALTKLKKIAVDNFIVAQIMQYALKVSKI